MNTPTPNPRPEPDIEEYAHGGSPREWEDEAVEYKSPPLPSLAHTVRRGQFITDEGLAARDARIRAEVAEEIAGMLGTFAANRREQNPKDLVAAAYLAAARHVREYAGNPAEPAVEPSAVPVEGSGHPQPATRVLSASHPVAEGRCENCGDPVVYNLAVGYVAHQDADESTTCTKPWPATRPILSLDTPEGATNAH